VAIGSLKSVEPVKTPKGNFIGYSKVTFENDSDAKVHFDNRMNIKYKEKKVFVDIVGECNKILMNTPPSVSAEDIEASKVFNQFQLTEIIEQKGIKDSNHYTLVFDNYKGADQAMDAKLAGNLGKINGEGFRLLYPGARRNFFNNRRNQNSNQNSKTAAAE